MGGKNSKRSKKPTGALRFEGFSPEEEFRVISQNSYDDAQILVMTRELEHNPQLFFLNCLLMGVMFFGNYEIERQKLMNPSLTTMQKELNSNLLRDETIECIIPDVLFEKVNQNIKFRFLHGPKKLKVEYLVPRRLYVVDDNIEVLESIDIPQYSAIDKPGYQVQIEEAKNIGFVKLRCEQKQYRHIKQTEPEPQPGTSNQKDDIYVYSRIGDLTINSTKPQRRDTLPRSCFVTKQVKKYSHSSDSDSSDVEESIKLEDLFEAIPYISSKGFWTHFVNSVFPNSLGRALGFDSTAIELAKVFSGRIHCVTTDEEENDLPCEIIPSVAIQWPAKITYEFHQRGERPKMVDKFNNIYEYPTGDMINEIRRLNCVLIPRGITSDNPDVDIEWEVGFPRAERYLDTRMTQAQMYIFLFLLTIFKSYIEPKSKHMGLLVEHIRHFMYWECESNPRDWPQHRLGTKLIQVLKNFINKLSVYHLPNFFIKGKNMFETASHRYLNHAQRIFHEVTESPAIYMLGALRNLVYTNPKFYPPLDFKLLHNILTTKTSLLLSNPTPIFRPPNLQKHRRERPRGDAEYSREISIKMKIERKNRERYIRRTIEEQEKEIYLQREQGSVDSIDLEWRCERDFDNLKKRQMLVFFINHFIDIAKRSRKLATQKQALLYLKQAYYLTVILGQLGLEQDSQEKLKIIEKEENISKKLSVSESLDLPPSPPKRFSSQMNWEMQVKGGKVNLGNLNESYQDTAVVLPSKTRKSVAFELR